MAGGLAHELRHPFSYVENSVYFIKKILTTLQEELHKINEFKWNETFKKLFQYVDTIKMANDREISIVKTVEAFAKRKERGQEIDVSLENYNFEKVDFKMYIKVLLNDARFLYETRNASQISVEIDAKDTLSLYADPKKLDQLFLNLFGNACDAMRESAEKKVTIKAYSLPDDPNFVQIEFQDTGSGIPEVLKDKVWEYMFTTKTHEGGSGIGLFWCRLAVETVHKGKIWFESKEDVGTTFFVKLPVWKDKVRK
jgi:signal transduction histidine kinase